MSLSTAVAVWLALSRTELGTRPCAVANDQDTLRHRDEASPTPSTAAGAAAAAAAAITCACNGGAVPCTARQHSTLLRVGVAGDQQLVRCFGGNEASPLL